MSQTKLVPIMKLRDAPLSTPVEALSYDRRTSPVEGLQRHTRSSTKTLDSPTSPFRQTLQHSSHPHCIYVWTASEAGYVSICTCDSMPIEFCQWISIPCCRGEQIPFARANTMIKAGKLPSDQRLRLVLVLPLDRPFRRMSESVCHTARYHATWEDRPGEFVAWMFR